MNKKKEIESLLSGKEQLPGAIPIALAYAGHQFGHFNMLGDGRALLIGEQITTTGQRFDLQLKGSGPTPYSRRGDGLATLSAMLREYLYSEAMYGLGIPTTRSLAVVKTGEQVVREELHEGAILTRIAQSHLRVGTFEYAAHLRDEAAVQELLHYTIERHYNHLKNESNPALALLHEVMNRQIDLIVDWMRVGFIHGVMNTDNMSISGETIDFGPCAFMNRYDPATVFSSIDRTGRYAFGNQPGIAQWNLGCLASALLSSINPDKEKAIELAKELLAQFPERFRKKWYAMMGNKIGLTEPDSSDQKCIDELLEIMKEEHADYTNLFLHLMEIYVPNEPIYQSPSFLNWKSKWHERIHASGNKMERIEKMKKNNPVYIPRNYLVEEALEQFVNNGNDTLYHRILNRMYQPYVFSESDSDLLQPPPQGDEAYRTFCNT